jgi:hypothetical protein
MPAPYRIRNVRLFTPKKSETVSKVPVRIFQIFLIIDFIFKVSPDDPDGSYNVEQ